MQCCGWSVSLLLSIIVIIPLQGAGCSKADVRHPTGDIAQDPGFCHRWSQSMSHLDAHLWEY